MDPTVALDPGNDFDLRIIFTLAAWALPLLRPLRVAIVGATFDLGYRREKLRQALGKTCLTSAFPADEVRIAAAQHCAYDVGFCLLPAFDIRQRVLMIVELL